MSKIEIVNDKLIKLKKHRVIFVPIDKIIIFFEERNSGGLNLFIDTEKEQLILKYTEEDKKEFEQDLATLIKAFESKTATNFVPSFSIPDSKEFIPLGGWLADKTTLITTNNTDEINKEQCKHEWEEKYTIFNPDLVARKFHICKKCGAIK